ncbi:SDR family NAD(P)-dependent oxidoreductase [Streptomyces dangxiongensis]|uniref:SDR family NAD(P)-dependent oxidoreductase n=1 Tax=Streptomyces dangxiongensis TaxID=1442032 RepID=A0A3G2J8M0_9ACTN|nr:SDR family NAD(P)-dependent oxidoreductase [Streptomyces dangxiongensis]
MPVNHLQHKVIVITVAAARGQEDLDQLVADIKKAGGTATARLTDVTDAADMQALADFTVDTYGRIDVLVNNAGLMLFSYWKDLSCRCPGSPEESGKAGTGSRRKPAPPPACRSAEAPDSAGSSRRSPAEPRSGGDSCTPSHGRWSRSPWRRTAARLPCRQ